MRSLQITHRGCLNIILGMTITTIPHEPFRFRVASDRRQQCQVCRASHEVNRDGGGTLTCRKCGGAAMPVEYVVDLAEHKGFAHCTCEAFQFRSEPKLVRGQPAKPCRHIGPVFEHFGRLVVKRALQKKV